MRTQARVSARGAMEELQRKTVLKKTGRTTFFYLTDALMADLYRKTAPSEEADQEAGELSEEQKQEILRRRAAYLADPSIAEPWAGTTERILQHLDERRRRKAAPSRV